MAQKRAEPSAQQVPMPPAELRATRCRCGAWYLDVSLGRDAHVAVFGHKPEKVEET